MKNLTLSLFLIGALSFGGVALAQDKPEAPKKQAKVQKTVDQLLKDLSADDYDVRESATLELVRRGATDKTVLEKVTKLRKESKDPEVKARTLFVQLKLKPPVRKKPIDRSKDPSFKLPRGLKLPKGMPKGFEMPKGLELPKGMPGLPKEFDLNKIFGGADFDLDSMFEQMGLPKGLGKVLQKVLSGEGELDLQKLIEEFGKLQNPAPAPKAAPKATPKPKRPNIKDPNFFGMAWDKPSDDLRAKVGLKKIDGGIVVLDIAEGTYAAKSGLKKGDIIIAVKGKIVPGPSALESLKDGAGEIVVIRDGKRQKITLPKWNAPKKASVNKDF